MLVFNSAYEKNNAVVENDAVVLVRGRVDHKERGETKPITAPAKKSAPSARAMTWRSRPRESPTPSAKNLTTAPRAASTLPVTRATPAISAASPFWTREIRA
jgi:hypothetical protein